MSTAAQVYQPAKRVAYLGYDILVTRVLITGSRTWVDRALMRAWLAWVWDRRAVLVTGRARGADLMAEDCWRSWGGEVDPCFAADWERYRIPGRRFNPAGFIRNHEMVQGGADICLAFIRNRSRGASHCAAWADLAGIPTVVIASDPARDRELELAAARAQRDLVGV